MDGIPIPDEETVKCVMTELSKLEGLSLLKRSDGIEDRLKVAIRLFSDLDSDTAAALTKQYNVICQS